VLPLLLAALAGAWLVFAWSRPSFQGDGALEDMGWLSGMPRFRVRFQRLCLTSGAHAELFFSGLPREKLRFELRGASRSITQTVLASGTTVFVKLLDGRGRVVAAGGGLLERASREGDWVRTDEGGNGSSRPLYYWQSQLAVDAEPRERYHLIVDVMNANGDQNRDACLEPGLYGGGLETL
jgi:hypothetical protein